MSSLRFARSAFRARPSPFRVPFQRRGYAEAVADKIKLSLVLPHQVRLRSIPSDISIKIETNKILFNRLSSDRLACEFRYDPRLSSALPTLDHPSVAPLLTNASSSVQVNIPAESGEMGVLANHVPSIEQLKPGLVEIMEEGGASKKFFRTSGPRLRSCLSDIRSIRGYSRSQGYN